MAHRRDRISDGCKDTPIIGGSGGDSDKQNFRRVWLTLVGLSGSWDITIEFNRGAVNDDYTRPDWLTKRRQSGELPRDFRYF
jgi:hypothetical protein